MGRSGAVQALLAHRTFAACIKGQSLLHEDGASPPRLVELFFNVNKVHEKNARRRHWSQSR